MTLDHVSLRVRDLERSRACYTTALALAAGGSDNGAPGLRPLYHANCYGAFIIDPDGNNADAVCHSAEA